jgi:UDP-N-acetylmuramoyl-tripeptide--D-alanyl-D-alanine ligase
MVGLRAAQVADILITLGVRAHIYAEAARRAGMKPSRIIEFEESTPVVEWLRTNLSKDDIALLKGSHGLRMDSITAALEVVS